MELGLTEPGATCDDCRWKIERNECPWDYEYDEKHPWAEDCCDFRNVDSPCSAFEEQKTSGSWKFVYHNPSYSPFDDSPDSLYECTNCGYMTGSTTKYCPMCGSKNQP